MLLRSVPQPVMFIAFNPTDVYPSSRLSITCEVSLAQEVDTPVRVGMRWNAPTPIYENNRITMREDRSTTFAYTSILLINSVLFSDAGFYTCIAIIEPRDTDDSAVIGVPRTTEGMNLEISEYGGLSKYKEFVVCLCHVLCYNIADFEPSHLSCPGSSVVEHLSRKQSVVDLNPS